MQAISIQAGAARLIARTNAGETGAEAKAQVQDPKSVASIIRKGEHDFPKGALIDGNKATYTKMYT